MTTETTNSSTEVIDERKPLPGDLGSLLREYKAESNLSYTQISEALCLPPSSIEKLENEDFDHLPEPPYVRGYLRNYARLADKDPSRIVTMYDALRGVTPDDNAMYFAPSGDLTTSNNSWVGSLIKGLLGLLLVGLIGFAAVNKTTQEWVSSTWQSFMSTDGDDSELAQSLTGVRGNLPALDALSNERVNDEGGNMPVLNKNTTAPEPISIGIATSPLDSSPATDTGVATLNQAMAEQNGTADDTVIETSEALPADVAPTAAGDAADTTVKIRLVFSKEVWMRIRDKEDGSVFEQVNKAGTEKEITLEKPLKFRVGNAQGLELFVDGEKMDIGPFIKGSIARFGLE